MKRLDKEAIEAIKRRLAPARSADLYDTLDAMGYPNQCMSLKIRPLRDDMRIVGPAFTILGTSEPRLSGPLPDQYANPDFDNFAMYDRLYEGCVIVLNAEKDDQVGHWGELMSYGARNSGAVGVVIDGGTRDKAGILKIDSWVCFAKYTSPIESEGRWRPKALEQPIFVSGSLTRYVKVEPGDWILGDCDGVMVIPQAILMDVLPRLEKFCMREDRERTELAAGARIKDVQVKEKHDIVV